MYIKILRLALKSSCRFKLTTNCRKRGIAICYSGEVGTEIRRCLALHWLTDFAKL